MTDRQPNDETIDLAELEKDASRSIELGTAHWVLLGCALVYLAAMFLPFAGSTSGWEIIGATEGSRAVQTKVTEYLFAWLSFAGVGLLTPLVLLTKRFVVAAPAWMISTLALILSILAIWLRRTSSSFDVGLHHGAGIYLAIAAVAVTVFAYIPVVLGRSGSQEEIARRRAGAEKRDDVALAQESAAQKARTGEGNPLLVDDRRARAAERHRKYEG
ncbi:hypothetical protein [Corynebacterium sp. UBA2622]|uniref:Rv2732c family membrane protein n=1 Tax=Corynebacterium sp. UBA2622 TaxID=1946393 RepID=UPI0025BA0C49|nr:hypothetical protein [Corynebacterium sp. UBA2622]